MNMSAAIEEVPPWESRIKIPPATTEPRTRLARMNYEASENADRISRAPREEVPGAMQRPSSYCDTFSLSRGVSVPGFVRTPELLFKRAAPSLTRRPVVVPHCGPQETPGEVVPQAVSSREEEQQEAQTTVLLQTMGGRTVFHGTFCAASPLAPVLQTVAEALEVESWRRAKHVPRIDGGRGEEDGEDPHIDIGGTRAGQSTSYLGETSRDTSTGCCCCVRSPPLLKRHASLLGSQQLEAAARTKDDPGVHPAVHPGVHPPEQEGSDFGAVPDAAGILGPAERRAGCPAPELPRWARRPRATVLLNQERVSHLLQGPTQMMTSAANAADMTLADLVIFAGKNSKFVHNNGSPHLAGPAREDIAVQRSKKEVLQQSFITPSHSSGCYYDTGINVSTPLEADTSFFRDPPVFSEKAPQLIKSASPILRMTVLWQPRRFRLRLSAFRALNSVRPANGPHEDAPFLDFVATAEHRLWDIEDFILRSGQATAFRFASADRSLRPIRIDTAGNEAEEYWDFHNIAWIPSNPGPGHVANQIPGPNVVEVLKSREASTSSLNSNNPSRVLLPREGHSATFLAPRRINFGHHDHDQFAEEEANVDSNVRTELRMLSCKVADPNGSPRASEVAWSAQLPLAHLLDVMFKQKTENRRPLLLLRFARQAAIWVELIANSSDINYTEEEKFAKEDSELNHPFYDVYTGPPSAGSPSMTS